MTEQGTIGMDQIYYRRKGEVTSGDKETADKEKKQENRREGDMTRREEARI